MSLKDELAAKALAARKVRAAEDKAIADERYDQRKAQAGDKVQSILEALHKVASGGATQSVVCIPDVCKRQEHGEGTMTLVVDDPIVDYFLARCREEGLTVTVTPGGEANFNANVAWGAGE